MTSRLFDIGGHDLGCPARVVRVVTKADLRAALADADAERRPVVAMGMRATYWHNLSLDGAVVVDMAGYDRILATNELDGYVTVESGLSIRRLDEHLRKHASHLPMHPDAYGDTPVGASIANGVTAGVGMLWGNFTDQVLGLEVMLADGTMLQVGASRMLHGRGPIAHGLPNLRSLFFGAEGAAGIITEIDFALIPAPWEARLSWQVDEDRFEEALACALYWRRRECAESMRWVWTATGELAITVASRVSEAEVDSRVSALRASVPWLSPCRVEVASDAERRGEQPDYERRWPGAPGSTWSRNEARPFAGIDAFVPYGRAREAYVWAREVTPSVPHQKRVAAYFGREGVNIGVHCSFDDRDARDRGRAEIESLLEQLAAFEAVPYRPGLVWMDKLGEAWDPRTLAALRSVAEALDPRRSLPGAGLLRRARPDHGDR